MSRVRVRPERALTLRAGDGTVLHLAGAELELEAAEAKALAEQGFIEPAEALEALAGRRRAGALRSRSGDEDELS